MLLARSAQDSITHPFHAFPPQIDPVATYYGADNVSLPPPQSVSYGPLPEMASGSNIQLVAADDIPSRTRKRKTRAAKPEKAAQGRQKRRRKSTVLDNEAYKCEDEQTEMVAPAISTIVPSPPSWKIVKPPRNGSKAKAQPHSVLRRPEIWAARRSDLVAIFPSLDNNVGGLTYMNFGVFPTLVWLIDGQGWPEDAWDDSGTSLDLCIVVDIVEDLWKVTHGEKLDQVPPSTSAASQPKTGISLEKLCKRCSSYEVQIPDLPAPLPTWIFEGCREHTTRNASELWPANLPVQAKTYYSLEPPTTLPQIPDNYINFNEREGCLTRSGSPPLSLGSPLTPLSSPETIGIPLRTVHEEIDKDDNIKFNERKTTQSPIRRENLAKIVPEITTMLHCHVNKIPIVLITGRDSSILPFQTSAEYGYAVLGFFDVASVEAEEVERQREDSNESFTQVRWRVKLDYSPPSEILGGNVKPPWWLKPEPLSTEGISDNGYPAPVSTLVESLDGMPERLWWHCTECGKLNLKLTLIHRRCSHCSREKSSASPTCLHNARIANKTSPDSFPSDDPPQSMKLSQPKTHPDNMRVFDYCYSETGSAIVKHVFTCNLSPLQEKATELFKQIQTDVELKLHAVNDVVALGPYYSNAFCQEDWRGAPECVAGARDLIRDHARDYGEEGNPEINRVVVVAWTNTGSKKGSFVSAHRSPVFVLCLGADADFYIEHEPGASSVAVKPLAKTGRKTGKAKAAMKAPAKIRKPKTERLRIGMVHGDVLIFRGGEFHYSLTRTGTTILVFGFESP